MAPPMPPALQPISTKGLSFSAPVKRILTHQDLPLFHSSPAYSLITAFIVHLNASVSPLDAATDTLNPPEDYTTSSPATGPLSAEVEGVTRLVGSLADLVDSAPPDQGPRRFGNAAFRRWLQLAESHVGEPGRADGYLPGPAVPAKEELLYYLTHSFGSGERLDYGTGHELAFAAFLCGIWVLGGFRPGRDERALVLRTFDAYFKLVRRLVTTYSLEPAGSHGVWGLDDHAFLPYIFGSAQLTTFRPLPGTQAADADASADAAGLPKPADVLRPDVVSRQRRRNLYFDAIGFICDVKKGPFWEHSPILYDISGVQKGWGKINEGMLKMYDKEVLGKFPVVQHFYFGNIFRWSASETAEELAAATAAAAAEARASESSVGSEPPRHQYHHPPPAPRVMENTRAPWAGARPTTLPTSALKPLARPATAAIATTTATAATTTTTHRPPQPSTNRRGSTPPLPTQFKPDTKAPWAPATPMPIPASPQRASPRRGSSPSLLPQPSSDTKAPWAAAAPTPANPRRASPQRGSSPQPLPPPLEVDTKAPWAAAATAPAPTLTPTAGSPQRAPSRRGSNPLLPPRLNSDTKAPWATAMPAPASTLPTSSPQRALPRRGSNPPLPAPDTDTKAPWAAAATTPTSTSPRRVSPRHSPFEVDTRAPWVAPSPTSPMLPRSPIGGGLRPAPADARPLPWEAGKEQREEEKEASGVNVRTQAQLGPRRTNSPDSALALSAQPQQLGEGHRRGSLGTGGVRVAETGDLSGGRRASRTG